MKLVCIGNSIVKGFPWSSGKSFPGRLRTISGWDIINKGIEGDISKNILARFSRDVIDKKPDIAIVLTGTNDYLMGGSSTQDVMERLVKMRDISEENGIEFIVLTPLMTKAEQASQCWMKGAGVDYDIVNKKLAEQAELIRNSGLHYIDTQKRYKEYGIYHDGLHPDQEGQDIIARTIYEELK